MHTPKFSILIAPALILILAVSAITATIVQAGPLPTSCTGGVIAVNAAGPAGLAPWGQALTDLNAAIALAKSAGAACQIWVAQGTYKPAATDRTVSFDLADGVSIYGGFAGNESSLAQRVWRDHPTILSGDLNGDDGPNFTNRSDNSYHVVKVRRVSDSLGTPLLDGFTITGGNADGTDEDGAGGGIFDSFTTAAFNNLVITGNRAREGGGVYSYNNNTNFTEVTFSGNYAIIHGGGMADVVGWGTLLNVTFSGNSAEIAGGGFYGAEEHATLINAVFWGNQALNGAGVFLEVSHPTLTNTSFSGNIAYAHGSGLYNGSGSYPTIQNSVLWGDVINPDVLHGAPSVVLQPGVTEAEIYDVPGDSSFATLTYTLVEGCKPEGNWNQLCGIDGGINREDTDPLFADAAAGNLRLKPSSPIIDHGNNDFVTGITTDRDGHPRIHYNYVDLGAYEITLYKQFVPLVRR